VTLRDLLRIAARWWIFVVVLGLLGGAGAFVATRQMTPLYRSTATLLVNQAQSPGVVTYQDILGSQQLTKTYAELATSNLNLERAVGALNQGGLSVRQGHLASSVSARPVTGTQLIAVSAEHRDPETAARYANTVSEEFIGYVREAQVGGAGADAAAAPVNSVFVAARATPAAAPFSPNLTLNVAVGLLAGVALAITIVAVFEYLNDRVTTQEEVERLGVPFLGRVVRATAPRFSRNGKSLLLPGADSGVLESVREVRASLSYALAASEAKVILVSSPAPGDGKSTTAAGLAAASAESAKRVLLIDGDLRKPDAHRYFSLPNSSGLSAAVMVKPEEIPSFLKMVSEHLYVLTAGPAPPNPSQIITSPRLRALLDAARRNFDLVIVDGPPLVGIADATLWAGIVDGVVVVTRHGRTRRGHLAEALRRLTAASAAPILGVVLNGATRDRAGYYYYASYPSGSDTPPVDPPPGDGRRVAPERAPNAADARPRRAEPQSPPAGAQSAAHVKGDTV